MKTSSFIGLLVGAGAMVTLFAACGSAKHSGFDPTDGADGSVEAGPVFGDAGDAGVACHGLQCQQKNCGGGAETTVTGKVYAPNGKLPLYNAVVYVPNADPDPLPQGVTCDKCGAVTGSPVVTALSDATGTFTLHNAPVGTNIPLIIQIGKWRRQVTIPEVKACTENKLTDPELTRLPKTQAEGNMPHIALTTGGCDNLGCMLPKVGIDPSEFGTINDGPSKAVHVYVGSGGGAPAGSPQAQTLWTDTEKMKQYDMLVLSCECSEHTENKGTQAWGAMTDYLTAGGRIFTTDFMYSWYRYTPDPDLKSSVDLRGGAPAGGDPMSIDTSFPKGKALSDWLQTVSGNGATVQPDSMYGNVISVDPAKTQEWAKSGDPNAGPRVFTVNVPVGVPADQQCGKGVHVDAHVNDGFGGGGGSDTVDSSYPNSCPNPLKPAENLIAFFFFDLASCIQDDTQPPQPPQVQ